MPCIHGLDEVNCPTCRITIFTLPKNAIKINMQTRIKSEYPFSIANSKENEEHFDELKLNLPDMHKTSRNLISNPKLLTKLPDFQNKMLLDRMREIEISKSNILKLSKKINLASPEWKPYNEE